MMGLPPYSRTHISSTPLFVILPSIPVWLSNTQQHITLLILIWEEWFFWFSFRSSIENVDWLVMMTNQFPVVALELVKLWCSPCKACIINASFVIDRVDLLCERLRMNRMVMMMMMMVMMDNSFLPRYHVAVQVYTPRTSFPLVWVERNRVRMWYSWGFG